MKQAWLIFLFLLSAEGFAKTKVAITVDDLPRHAEMPANTTRLLIASKMLTAFKNQSLPEVYGFLNSEKLNQDISNLEIIKLWTTSGYPLGNHTYSHKNINITSTEDFIKDITRNEAPLKELSGTFNWKYFRYPFLREGNSLEKRNSVRTYLKENGYKIAQVTIDFEDWAWNEPYARCFNKEDLKQIEWLKESYLKNAVDHLRRAESIAQGLFHRSISHILLLHIGAFDAEMTEELLKLYKKEGVEFITLKEALDDEIFKIDPRIPDEKGDEFTYQIMQSRGLKLKDIGLKPYMDFPKEKLTSVCR